MDNKKNNQDVTKSLERYYSSTSSASQGVFDSADYLARKGSDIKTYFEDKKQLEEEQRKAEEEQKKTDEEDKEQVNSTDSSKEQDAYTSRLKTNENIEENSETPSQESTSRIKTNVNQPEQSQIDTDNDKSNIKKKSRLKTAVTKTGDKVFKFNKNQGKISKTITVASKTGKVVSKYGKVVSKGSRAVKTISDGTDGMDYVQKQVGEKAKRKGAKLLKKQGGKIAKPLLKKLASAFKIVFVKVLKLLLVFVTYIATNIVPILFVVLAIAIVSSIFGGGSSKSSIEQYEAYMINIQAQYDAEVDRFRRENPDGIVVGARGDYGQINWKAPLSIIQGTGATTDFDMDEQILLNQFKNAGLFEKHEIIEQTIKTDDKLENSPEKKVKVLVISNASYQEYLDWCKNNYSVIAQFNAKKKVGTIAEKYFNPAQLETIELLYNSNDFGEQFTSIPFTTVVMGKVDTLADLNSEFYNSKNVLTNAGFKGQCTWYAYGRALETTGKKMPTGNAQTWLSSAVTMGYETGTEPSKNAIAVLSGGNYGHVAFVEEYTPDKLVISEGNIGNPCSKKTANCSQKEYANEHFAELVRTTTYSSFKAYQDYNTSIGYKVIGFIYLV